MLARAVVVLLFVSPTFMGNSLASSSPAPYAECARVAGWNVAPWSAPCKFQITLRANTSIEFEVGDGFVGKLIATLTRGPGFYEPASEPYLEVFCHYYGPLGTTCWHRSGGSFEAGEVLWFAARAPSRLSGTGSDELEPVGLWRAYLSAA